jgi:hypothetical protein
MLRTSASTGTFCHLNSERLQCSRTRHNLKQVVQSSPFYLQIAAQLCIVSSTLFETFSHIIGAACGRPITSQRRCLFRSLGRSIGSPGQPVTNRFSGCKHGLLPLRQNGGTAGTHSSTSWTRRPGGRRGPTGRRTISPEPSSLTSRPPTPNAPLPRLLFSLRSNQPIVSTYIVVRRT